MPVSTLHAHAYFTGSFSRIKTRLVIRLGAQNTGEWMCQEHFARTYTALTGGVL